MVGEAFPSAASWPPQRASFAGSAIANLAIRGMVGAVPGRRVGADHLVVPDPADPVHGDDVAER
jgi:hypothetical protein